MARIGVSSGSSRPVLALLTVVAASGQAAGSEIDSGFPGVYFPIDGIFGDTQRIVITAKKMTLCERQPLHPSCWPADHVSYSRGSSRSPIQGSGSVGGGSSARSGSAPSSSSQAQPSSENETKVDPCAEGESPTTTGNPVLLTTGEKLLAQTDFVVGGFYGFDLTRTYRSRQTGSLLFGPKWSSGADAMRISWSSKQTCEPGGPCAPKDAVLTETDGSQYKYVTDPG